jgi:hypothetical protein
LSATLLSKLTSSRQGSAASRRRGYAKAAACSVCHVPDQSTVRRIEAVSRTRPVWQCHFCLCLTEPKKRERFSCTSPERRQFEFQEKIYNQHVRLLSSEPFGWFAPPKFTRAWEPTLLWNHCPQNSPAGFVSAMAWVLKESSFLPNKIEGYKTPRRSRRSFVESPVTSIPAARLTCNT